MRGIFRKMILGAIALCLSVISVSCDKVQEAIDPSTRITIQLLSRNGQEITQSGMAVYLYKEYTTGTSKEKALYNELVSDGKAVFKDVNNKLFKTTNKDIVYFVIYENLGQNNEQVVKTHTQELHRGTKETYIIRLDK